MITKERIKLDARIDLKNKFNYSIALDDYRIGGMKWNDVDNGRNFEFSVNKQDILDALHINQTQKAIECLREVKKQIVLGTTIFWIDRDINKKILQDFSFEIQQIIKEIIDNKIKELEEEK